jgi:hypothetical protein
LFQKTLEKPPIISDNTSPSRRQDSEEKKKIQPARSPPVMKTTPIATTKNISKRGSPEAALSSNTSPMKSVKFQSPSKVSPPNSASLKPQTQAISLSSPSDIARSSAYPNTPEWLEVEDWLGRTVGITRSYERKGVLEAFLSANLTSLNQISRINGEQLNKMPLSFELRMKLLPKCKDLQFTQRRTT